MNMDEPRFVCAGWRVACIALLTCACSGAIETPGADTGPAGGAPGNMPSGGGPTTVIPGIGTVPTMGNGTPSMPAAVCDPRAPAPGPAALRLLTRLEFDNTVRDLLGDGTRPASALPREDAVSTFITSDTLRINAKYVQGLMDAADGIVTRARAGGKLAVACDPARMGPAVCADQFIRQFGVRFYRRPPTTGELDGLKKTFMRVLPDKGFDGAIDTVVKVGLQSPQFLYRVESATGTPSAFEVASRLSYFLWASMPDDVLFRAAERNELTTSAQVDAQARRLLADPRARAGVSEFFKQWLHAENLVDVVKNTTTFPAFKPTMGAEWRDSLLAFVDHVIWGGAGTFTELMSSPKVFLPGGLASLYGMRPANAATPVTFPAAERPGLLGQPALMALLAKASQSNPVGRGVFVRHEFICDPPPPPPDDAVIAEPTLRPGVPTRQLFAEHANNALCGACHKLFDPIGFGLENYDALGRFQRVDNGAPVDASGAINQTPDPTLDGPFDGAAELSRKLAASKHVRACFASHLTMYAFGRALRATDACTMSRINDAFLASGGDIRELLVAIATADAFRQRPLATGGVKP